MSTDVVSLPQTPAHADHGHHDAMESNSFGFWLYILSDLILFATLFATFAMLRHNNADGPAGHELFNIRFVFAETMLLLISSVTCGFAMIGLQKRNVKIAGSWLVITFLLGLGFIVMEFGEFRELIAEGNGPSRSAFLSAFFTLVGTHGAHVAAGLIWIIVMVAQLFVLGITPAVQSRALRLAAFWHFLDVVWVGVFSFVYLMGALP